MTLGPLRSTLDHFAKDAAYAVRGLRRAPLFAAIVTITLAFGIGVNSTVLGVIDEIYVRKLPVPEPTRIIGIYSSDRRAPANVVANGDLSSESTLDAIRQRVRGVVGVASYSMVDVSAGDVLAGEPMFSALVSGNYFDVLGIAPQVGRFIRPDEEEPAGAHPIVVISDEVWRSRFGADPRVIGRQLPIHNTGFTIVGVTPRGFTGLHPEGRTNLWIPKTMAREVGGGDSGGTTRSERAASLFARLAPGASLAEVRASLAVATAELRSAHPRELQMLDLRAAVRDRLTTVQLSPSGLAGLGLVWLMVALLHLVACSNVASLMYARVIARRREIGVRLCLGATRARILAQALTEAMMLAVPGAVAGLFVGRVLTGYVTQLQFLSAIDVRVDARVVAIVVLIMIVTVLQIGLLPAIDASRADPLSVLRGAGGGRRGTLRDRSGIVIVSQIAMSLLLLANAVAFVRLFDEQTNARPGFDADHLVIASIKTVGIHSTPSDWSVAYDDVVARISAVPGVRSIVAAQGVPLFNNRWAAALDVPGRVMRQEERQRFSLQAVGPGYFAGIGAPVLRGREFTTEDRTRAGGERGSYDVVVVNQTLARRFWPNSDPVGKQLALRGEKPATVVGVVGDMHDVSTVAYAPRAFFPLFESRFPSFEVAIRFDTGVRDGLLHVAGALRGSSSIERPSLRTMDDIRDGALSTSRAASIGLAACAGVALLLTAIGLYGVVTMWAARRRQEIGIRIALGAPALAIHGLLMSEIGRLAGSGAAIGLACAFIVVQVERSQMGPIISLGIVPAALSLAGLGVIVGVSALLPSLRATRRSPADVLRE